MACQQYLSLWKLSIFHSKKKNNEINIFSTCFDYTDWLEWWLWLTSPACFVEQASFCQIYGVCDLHPPCSSPGRNSTSRKEFWTATLTAILRPLDSPCLYTIPNSHDHVSPNIFTKQHVKGRDPLLITVPNSNQFTKISTQIIAQGNLFLWLRAMPPKVT